MRNSGERNLEEKREQEMFNNLLQTSEHINQKLQRFKSERDGARGVMFNISIINRK